MNIKYIEMDDFINYKKPSMFISTYKCDWKCCREGGFDISVCQNSPLCKYNTIKIENCKIISMYESSILSSSVVIGGLEPIDDFDDVLSFIDDFRKNHNDDIVIYTGYYENEIKEKIEILKKYTNIIIKFGRYKPNSNKRYDNILGVTLASDNQYAIKIS